MVRKQNRRLVVARAAAWALTLTLVAGRGALGQGEGQLTVSPTLLLPGGTVSAIWSGTRAPSSRVRLAIIDVSSGRHIGPWYHSLGAASGSRLVALPDGLHPGTYELRLVDEDARLLLARSNRLTVDNGAFAFAVSPVRRPPGGLVSVTWGRVAEGPYWVGLYTAGAPDTDVRAWQATSGRVFGSLPFPLPAHLPAGIYEFRLFGSDRWSRIATSNQLVVRPGDANLTVGPVEAAPGGAVTAIWTGIAAPTSTVRIFLSEAGSERPMGSGYRDEGTSNGNRLFDLPKNMRFGTYELLLYDADLDNLLAQSNRFTVDSVFR